ncbi:MAG: ABC transporter permease [Candidatus Pacebacteria bacterium]|nr:ABC transporter permease [Candidatus Paceibacterota bacterium]MDD4333614.1 ABC transporter permease [Candidatus Paceibacterota bacterium]
MSIFESIKISISMLLKNKMQSFLTMLGIIIGVMSVVIVMSVGASSQEFILNEVKTIGTDLIGILPGSSEGAPASVMGIVNTSLKYEDGEKIVDANFSNVDSLAMYVQGNVKIVAGENDLNVSFSGSTDTYLTVEKVEIAEGRFYTKEEEKNYSRVVVLGSEVAKKLFGDQSPIGEKVKIKDLSFKVIGVFKEKGKSLSQDQDNSIVVPIKTAQKLLLGIDYINFMRVKVVDEKLVDFTKEDIELILRESHNIDNEKDDDFTINATATALESIKSITDAITLFLVAVSAISLVVGGFGIMNIMLATVEERVSEIGLRKALGAKEGQIVTQFLIETVVITFLSGLIGIILGIFISFVIYKVIIILGTNWFFIIPFWSIILAAFVSISIGLIFGIIPAKKASKLDPIEALRYE